MNEPNYRCEYVACICPKCHRTIALKVYVKQPILRAEIAEPCEEERMTKHQYVEQAKEEAKRNLTGEDLEKCIKALEAWDRNTMTEAYE